MKQSTLIGIVLMLISSSIYGQKRDYAVIEAELETKTGVERIRVVNELANQDIYNDQDLARSRAWNMIDSAKVYDHQVLMGWGYRYVGLSYDFEGVLDSARYYYLKSIPFFEEPKEHGWAYFNIAYSFQMQTQLDSANKYLTIAESLFKQDTTAIKQLGSVIGMKGDIASMQGDQSLAVEYHIESSKYFEKAGDMRRYSNAIEQLGEVYNEQGEHRKAIAVHELAARICRENNEAYYESASLMGLGNSFHALGIVDSAMYFLDSGLEISRNVNNDYVSGSILQALAGINTDEGNVNIARQQFQESNEFFEKLEDIYSITFNKERQARMEYNLNNHNQVIRLTNEGIALAETQDLFELKSDLLIWKSRSLEKIGNHKQAFSAFKSYQSIKDSLNSKDRSDKLQELLVEYETEKTEKELVIAQAENDRKSASNKLLLLGLIAFGLVAAVTVYTQIVKRRKDRLIADQEKAIEIEKRRNAEQELEFKQKELVAKTLQLARKNEFLSSLDEEVSGLKSSIDKTMKSSTDRIRRMIQHDANDDDDWEHFAKEFSSIHQGFIDTLKGKYGSFTTNELRLISLMKMNLSSKDIASTLRISGDGIKKARYRLRKKMKLESSVDIQAYLLAFG